MCGIAGIINGSNRPVALKQLENMANAIAHRGPDDYGYYSQGPVGLAFRRLAIIDLSAAGHQPMTNEDGTVFVVFNGEIYNFLELRPLLQQQGHLFSSQTDTEVIVHAYEQYGEDCVHHFKGMFAFAIWDSRKHKLFCARDRFGIKPFYYRYTPRRFIFGSEIKAILATDHTPVSLNYQALNEYFTFQNVLTDVTLFNGINLLPPGHTLTVTNGKMAIRQYWDVSFRPTPHASFEQLTAQVRNGFDQSVTRHMIGDVPVGSHLSGGMDSGSIVAVASKQIPRLMTFTGGFDTTGASGLEMFFDERSDAEIIARTFGTTHYEMVIHAGDMSHIMPKLIWHLEELRVGMSYQNYYINQLASKFVKVVLAGSGGDELFGGYAWRYQLIEKERSFDKFLDTYYQYWTRLIPDREKKKAFRPETWKLMKDYSTQDVFRSIMTKTKSLSPINRALYFELKSFLHGLLVIEDKVSSAHSIESRVPFLDHDLVDLALTIPDRMKARDGIGKLILRHALEPRLPASIVKKKKQGFSAPEETWYRGAAYTYVRSIILSRRALNRGYFSKKYVETILEHHHNGARNHRLLIWSLLSFEWWCRIFLDNEKPQ